MFGNVWEWTINSNLNDKQCIMGGAYNISLYNTFVADLYSYTNADSSRPTIGFRVVKSCAKE